MRNDANEAVIGMSTKRTYTQLYRRTRYERLIFGRWRVYSYRTHFERGYTRHWHLYGRDEAGKLERSINDFSLSAYRIRGWRLTASVRIEDGAIGSNAELSFYFALPFLGQLFFSIGRAAWLVRMTGLEYVIGKSKYGDSERIIEFSWHNSAITIALWGHEDRHWGTWRYKYIDLRNKLLGRAKYSEGPRETHEAVLTMPEAEYPLKVELYTATWKRRRWPRVKSIQRADVTVLAKGGVPFPGKGENDWDLDDDAVFEMTCPAATVEEAVEVLRASVVRDRKRYGGSEWRPGDK